MRVYILPILSCVFFGSVILLTNLASSQECMPTIAVGESIVPGQLLLVIRQDYPEIADSLTRASQAGSTITGVGALDNIGQVNGLLMISRKPSYSTLAGRGFVLQFTDSVPLEDIMRQYCALPYVEFVEPNFAIPTTIGAFSWSSIKKRFMDSEQ